MKKMLALAACTAVLTACTTTSTTPVMARADGIYETTGLGNSKTKAQEAALAAAKKQCGVRSPVVISDSSSYNGVFDEKTGRMLEQGVGIVGAIFGKSTPNLSRNDDYEYSIKFQCK